MKNLTLILSGVVVGFVLSSGMSDARADAKDDLNRIANAVEQIASNTQDLDCK